MQQVDLSYQASGRLLLSDGWQQARVAIALHGYAMTAEMMYAQLKPLLADQSCPGLP